VNTNRDSEGLGGSDPCCNLCSTAYLVDVIHHEQINATFANSVSSRFPKNESYLVAVSGGRDSMALLHFLQSTGYQNLVLCHVNHCLRGAESDADQALVEEAAKSLGLTCEVHSSDVAAHAVATSQSIEAAAREIRYRFFSDVASASNCKRLILAHHADDQVETVLINFFRGSGSRGISGMDQISQRVVNQVELTLIRPFLNLSREAIDRYVSKHDISFREDESNAEEFALRNRIRNRLIPTLAEVFERDIRPAVLRSAELAHRTEQWAKNQEAELPRKENGLDVSSLRKMPDALRDRLLLAWLRESGIPDCGFSEVAKITQILISESKPAKTNLPGNHHARRRAGILFLEFPDADGKNPK